MLLIQASEPIEVYPALKERFARISERCAGQAMKRKKKTCKEDRGTWDAWRTDKKATVDVLNANITVQRLTESVYPLRKSQ